MADNIIQLNGTDLRRMLNDALGGYKNAVKTTAILDKLNEGKDALWAILKALDDQYVLRSSQSTDATADNYFGPLSTASREYTLPIDFRHMKFIECVTSGYEDAEFQFRRLDSEEYRSARRASTAAGPTSAGAISTYLYTYAGRKLELAQYPEAALQLVMWYEFWIPDFSDDTPVTDVLLPYTKKIVDYAAKKLMLPLQDETQFEEWSKQWREEVLLVATGAPDQNKADTVVVEDFVG